jgi:hypothetical protein
VVEAIFWSLLLYQLSMMGIFLLYSFKPGSVAAILPIVTVVFWYLLHMKYNRRARFLPLEVFKQIGNPNKFAFSLTSRRCVLRLRKTLCGA